MVVLETVLRELGNMNWDPKIGIPVANAENKSFEIAVNEEEQNVSVLRIESQVLKERVSALESHLKYVTKQLGQTQNVYKAHQRDLESEQNLRHLFASEESQLKEGLRSCEHEATEVQERTKKFNGRIKVLEQNLTAAHSNIHTNRDNLIEWLEEVGKAESDNSALTNYLYQDEVRIKEIQLQLEKLNVEVLRKKVELEDISTDGVTAHVEVERAATEYNQAHTERQESLRQWENTLEQMMNRDDEVNNMLGYINIAKEKERNEKTKLDDKNKLLDIEERNNQEVRRKISHIIRTGNKQKEEELSTQALCNMMEDQVLTSKISVECISQDLDSTRVSNKQMKKQIAEYRNRTQKLTDQQISLQEKIEQGKTTQLTTEQQVQRLEQLLQAEEQRQQELDTDLGRLRSLQQTKTHQLFECENEEKNIRSEMQSTETISRNLKSHVNQLEQRTSKQHDIIYKQGYDLADLERRIAHMAGNVVETAAKKQLEEKVKDLHGVVDGQNSLIKMLSQQVKILQDDIRRTKMAAENADHAYKDIQSKVSELELEIENAERQIRKAVSDRQSLMVDENLQKVEIKRLQNSLNQHVDHVISLEKEKLGLEAALMERSEELVMHREMQLVKLKLAEAEKQRLASEMTHRNSKIYRLKNRCEILLQSLGDSMSEKDHIVKLAKEKVELQHELEEMEARVHLAENELIALKNVVQLLKGQNKSLTQSLTTSVDSEDDRQEKGNLEMELQEVTGSIKERTAKLAEIQRSIEVMQQECEDLSLEKQEGQLEITETANLAVKMEDDIKSQKEKLQRADQQLQKLTSEMKETDGRWITDISVRLLRESNRALVDKVVDYCKQHPEYVEAFEQSFTESGLPPLLDCSRASSRVSVLSVSSRSSSNQSLTGNLSPGGGDLGGRSASQLSTGRRVVEARSSATSTVRRSGASPRINVVTLSLPVPSSPNAGSIPKTPKSAKQRDSHR